MSRQNIYVTPATREYAVTLAEIYGDMSSAIEEALRQLHRFHYPELHPPVAAIIGYDSLVLSQPGTCSDTGRLIPAGETAWREVWSDNRPGALFSREALEADGIL